MSDVVYGVNEQTMAKNAHTLLLEICLLLLSARMPPAAVCAVLL
jgi:hypothetical protein